MELKPDKKSLLFSGGKLIGVEPSENNQEGFKMTWNADDKTWTINVIATISQKEAETAIYKYSDLQVDQGHTSIEESNPNMPFFTATDEHGNAVFAPLVPNSTIFPFFYRDQFGSITLKLNIGGLGKTQNPKTQNSHT